MKYVATINGKKYEVEVEKLEAYKSLDRNGVAAPAAPVQHMQSLTCRSCGAALEEGQKFCTKCGTPVA